MDFSNEIEISEVVDNWRTKKMVKNYCDYALKVVKVYYSGIKYDNCMIGSRSYIFDSIVNACFEYIKRTNLIRYKSSFYSNEKLKIRLLFTTDRYVVNVYNGRSRVGYVSKPSCYVNMNDSFIENISHAIWYCFRMMSSIDEQEIDQKIAYKIFTEEFIKKIGNLFDVEIGLYDIFTYGVQ